MAKKRTVKKQKQKLNVRYPFMSKKVVAVVHIQSPVEINRYMQILPRLVELDVTYDNFTLAFKHLLDNFSNVDIEGCAS